MELYSCVLPPDGQPSIPQQKLKMLLVLLTSGKHFGCWFFLLPCYELYILRSNSNMKIRTNANDDKYSQEFSGYYKILGL
jgi:hypothetical protein